MRSIAIQFPKFIAVPVEYLSTDRALPYSVHVLLDGKLIVLRKAGDMLTAERIKSLLDKAVQFLYVPKSEWQDFINSLEKNLQFPNEETKSEEGSALSAKALLFDYVRSWDDQGNDHRPMLEKLEKMTQKLSSAISKEIALAGKLLRRYNDPSVYFANHSLNTCIFSTAIGLKYGLKGAELQELSFAACIANIGLTKVPKEVLLKPSEPTTEEWKLLRAHPQAGEAILRSCLVSPQVCQAVLHHHERYDGTGYPNGIAGEDINLFARIIAIAEQFSAKTSVRPWAAPISAERAIAEIRAEAGHFDPQLLKMSLSKS